MPISTDMKLRAKLTVCCFLIPGNKCVKYRLSFYDNTYILFSIEITIISFTVNVQKADLTQLNRLNLLSRDESFES